MDDFSLLGELLNNEAKINLQNNPYGKSKIILSEPKTTDHKGYEVHINKMPQQAIVFKVDKFPAPTPIFKGSKGEAKRADFLIITEDAMVFIELQKIKNKTTKEIIQQFKGAQCFIDYCRSIVEKFWNTQDFLKTTKYSQYFVSIKNISMPKKPTRIAANAENTSPENMLKLNSPHHLTFRQLMVD